MEDYKNYIINMLKDSTYQSYKGYKEYNLSTYEFQKGIAQTIYYAADSYEGVDRRDASKINSDFLASDGPFKKLVAAYDTAIEFENEVAQLNTDIQTLKNDILGQMRSLAGEYNRLIFGFLFLMLLFQLIGLLILYIKRLFMIALLITVFPIVMLFYCIDKMGDGSAQTLSLWFKELLANVFIQSVHAVIYRVLVEAGLEVFQKDGGNWILLVTAMLLLLPAEAIMKEIFGLNGRTLAKVGGTLERAAIGIGALRALATAGKGQYDKSISKAESKFNKNINRKQERANLKASKREFKKEINDRRAPGLEQSARNLAYKAGDWAYDKGNQLRAARKKIHGARKAVGTFTRTARNVATISAGAVYGLSGGDVESLAKGAALARTLSGKQGKDKDYQKAVEDAYRRKKSK